MMKKHKSSWEAIQRNEERVREDKRDANSELMAKALTKALGASK